MSFSLRRRLDPSRVTVLLRYLPVTHCKHLPIFYLFFIGMKEDYAIRLVCQVCIQVRSDQFLKY